MKPNRPRPRAVVARGLAALLLLALASRPAPARQAGELPDPWLSGAELLSTQLQADADSQGALDAAAAIGRPLLRVRVRLGLLKSLLEKRRAERAGPAGGKGRAGERL
jgi:hypothetical protein